MAHELQAVTGPSRRVLESKAFAEDPYSHYRRWLAAGAARRVEDRSEWMILSHDGVAQVLRDASFSSNPNRAFSGVLHGADAPEHTRVRKEIQALFERRAQLSQRAAVRAQAERLLLKNGGRRNFDAVRELAAPIARGTACDWLGIHEGAVGAIATMPVKSVRWKNVEQALVPDGPLATLATSTDLEPDELAELIAFFLVAGIDTVRDALLLCLLAMMRQDSGLDRFSGSPADAVNELIRLEPPVHCVVRRAVSDTIVGGVPIPAGTLVWACLASANRDPVQFKDPDVFVADRPRASLSFGTAMHTCPGRHLGRLEAEEMLGALLPHLDGLRRNSSEPEIRFNGPGGAPALRQIVKWKMSFGSRG